MADVRDSPLTELSELSEAESLTTDEEIESGKLRGTLDSWVKAGLQVSKKKRPASPPHDYAPEDDSSIAVRYHSIRVKSVLNLRQVIVMFRSRFTDAFSKTLPNYGPQDIERGVLGAEPEEMVERLLAALLSLCLNRKKDVEYVSARAPTEMTYVLTLYVIEKDITIERWKKPSPHFRDNGLRYGRERIPWLVAQHLNP